ncbi:MAG: T9SS type A sorting domain-containing protein, partial [Bacteroidota bacterium]
KTYWYANNQWNHASIDWGQGKGNKYNPISAECGALTGNASDGIFYRGTDDKIHHFFWQAGAPGNGWVHEVLDDIVAGGNNPDWEVGGDVEISNDGHIYYRGANGKLQQYYRNGEGQWTHATVDWSGIPENEVSDQCGAIAVVENGVGGEGVVFYRGRDDKMHRVFFDPDFTPQSYPGAMANDWVHETLPYDLYTFQLITGDIDVNEAGTQVYYRGADGVQKYSLYDGHWYHAWLDDEENSTGNQTGAIEIAPSERVFFVDNTNTFTGLLKAYTKTIQSTGEIIDPDCDVRTTIKLTGTETPPSDSDGMQSPRHEEDSIPQDHTDVTISPNPLTDKFTLTMASPLNGDITITNAFGQKIKNIAVDGVPSIEVDTSMWPAGIYHVSFQSRNNDPASSYWVRKIVKN